MSGNENIFQNDSCILRFRMAANTALAVNKMIKGFPNSEGWNVTPIGNWIQAWEPPIAGKAKGMIISATKINKSIALNRHMRFRVMILLAETIQIQEASKKLICFTIALMTVMIDDFVAPTATEAIIAVPKHINKKTQILIVRSLFSRKLIPLRKSRSACLRLIRFKYLASFFEVFFRVLGMDLSYHTTKEGNKNIIKERQDP